MLEILIVISVFGFLSDVGLTGAKHQINKGQDVGHTDKHDCQHSKDPECDISPTISEAPNSPTPTVAATTTPTPSIQI